MKTDRNIVYFKGRKQDNLFIGIDANEVIAMLAVKKVSMIIGESAEDETMLFLENLGEEKPMMVLGSPEEVCKKLGWPHPPKALTEYEEPPVLLKAPLVDIAQ